MASASAKSTRAEWSALNGMGSPEPVAVKKKFVSSSIPDTASAVGAAQSFATAAAVALLPQKSFAPASSEKFKSFDITLAAQGKLDLKLTPLVKNAKMPMVFQGSVLTSDGSELYIAIKDALFYARSISETDVSIVYNKGTAEISPSVTMRLLLKGLPVIPNAAPGSFTPRAYPQEEIDAIIAAHKDKPMVADYDPDWSKVIYNGFWRIQEKFAAAALEVYDKHNAAETPTTLAEFHKHVYTHGILRFDVKSIDAARVHGASLEKAFPPCIQLTFNYDAKTGIVAAELYRLIAGGGKPEPACGQVPNSTGLVPLSECLNTRGRRGAIVINGSYYTLTKGKINLVLRVSAIYFAPNKARARLVDSDSLPFNVAMLCPAPTVESASDLLPPERTIAEAASGGPAMTEDDVRAAEAMMRGVATQMEFYNAGDGDDA